MWKDQELNKPLKETNLGIRFNLYLPLKVSHLFKLIVIPNAAYKLQTNKTSCNPLTSSWSKCWIQPINIKRYIHWTTPHLLPDFLHQRYQRFMPSILSKNQSKTLQVILCKKCLHLLHTTTRGFLEPISPKTR